MLTHREVVLPQIDIASASIVSAVEEAIEEAILERKLSEGEPLTEAHLAAALGVSRSPVRDALKRLAHKGLVRSRGRRGFAVATFSEDEIADFFGLREVLEGLAARLAAERIQTDELQRLQSHLDGAERQLASPDPCGYPAGEGDFHGTIARAARSPQLDAALAPIQARLRLLRRRSGAAAERARQALVEHRAIFSAIERHDPDEAEVLMRAHIRMAQANLLGRTSAPDPDGSRPDLARSRPDPDGPDPSGAAR